MTHLERAIQAKLGHQRLHMHNHMMSRHEPDLMQCPYGVG